MRKRKVFERALASSRAVSRDLLHTTRSLYRRDHVNELVPRMEPRADVLQAKPPLAREDAGAIRPLNGDDGDLTLQLRSFIPGITLVTDENEEYPDSIRRTRPLTPPEDSRGRASPILEIHSLFPRPPSSVKRSDSTRRSRPLTPENGDGRQNSSPETHSLFPRPPSSVKGPRPPSSMKRSKTEFSPPHSKTPSDSKSQPKSKNSSKSKISYDASQPTDSPLNVNSRPPIPPRKDSLPQRRVGFNLLDQVTNGDMRDSIQSVTAYVSADYSEIPTTPPLTMTSWLSDPDGPPDDLASWNQPSTAQQRRGDRSKGSAPAATRPQMAPRSKTTPTFNTAVPPAELPDARYERILREKLRHHAGQVKKRLDTSTYYSPTVRQNEVEIHLAFVRAAEEILKQSPIWHGAQDDAMKLRYLLEV